MESTVPVGEIVTFYSYKGGTGRTMALANIAYLLARDSGSKDVLMVDWDLEAPGLHRYFHGLVQGHFQADPGGEEFDRWPGLIDLLLEANGLVGVERGAGGTESAKAIFERISLDRFIVKTDLPSLYLLKAGRFDGSYSLAVGTFDWEDLHARSPLLFHAFAQYLAERFRYVLIDSRTGITDSGGICTCIMPDSLVLVFTPNRQSLFGALETARKASRYRKDSDDLRPLRIFPLASRIEAAEPVLRDRWRFGDLEEGIPGYQPAFETLFDEIYALPHCDLDRYFSEIQIQHVPRFAYGEEIAARIESGDRLSLTRSFECFSKRLLDVSAPWEHPNSATEPTPDISVRDEAWITEKRASTEAARKMSAHGFMEASFFLSAPKIRISQKRLFQAAQAAQISGPSWPIGAVLATPESRPKPTSEGISAEIIDGSKSYDCWTVREDGSFYFLRTLEEEPEYLLTDDRISRMTELLLYCNRLYSFLGVEKATPVRISVCFGGLGGRALGCRKPDVSDDLLRLTGTSTSNEATAEVMVELARIRLEIVRLIIDLTRPLFSLFDFYELPMGEYERLVRKSLTDWGFGDRL